MRGPNGFTLIEVLISLALLTIAAVPILWICAAAHRLSRSQAEASDLQQRARVAAEKLQRDLAMAGSGPPDGAAIRLVDLLGPIIPARTGFRLADPELSAFSDRISILYVPADGWACALSGAMPAASADVPIDPAARGCGAAGLCGFLEGSRALVLDTRARGAGFELFTVTGIAGALAHGTPNVGFSQAYAPPSARVMPIVQRTYYFDRSGRRLMAYDGHLSDVPLLDNVVDLRFCVLRGRGAGSRVATAAAPRVNRRSADRSAAQSLRCRCAIHPAHTRDDPPSGGRRRRARSGIRVRRTGTVDEWVHARAGLRGHLRCHATEHARVPLK